MTGTRLWVVRGIVLVLVFLAGVMVGSTGSEPAGTVATTPDTYTCSMHPNVQQPEPGLCPLCGMDLIPNTTQTAAASDRIVLSDRARALARLRTTPVRRQADATADVRLLGRIEPDERSRRNVTTWIGGRIDRLTVNTTGESVGRGRVIATLYSPEVYSAHQDLIAARRQVERLKDSPADARALAEAALSAARERLQLLGVPDRELAELAAADTPTRAIRIRSPFGGTVIERVATEGAYVETGAILYRVADLSRLWVQLDAYEADLPLLTVGLPVTLRVEGLAGEVFEGRIAFIDPTVDPDRRTARVRVEVDNPEGLLRPGMFAEALVAGRQATDDEAPLVIPASAPLFTGKRSLVYVESDGADGLAYTPRTVRLGTRLGDVYPVVAGLSEGERVVSRGAFALDADLQIRGGPSMMSAAPDDTPAQLAVPTLNLASVERAQLAPVLSAYLAIQVALAEDDHPTAKQAAVTLGEALQAVTLGGPVGEAWATLAPALTTHGQAIAGSSDIEAARGSFEPLSLAVEAWLRQLGNPLDAPVKVAFCPMAMGSAGARWVQQGDVVDNAYYGAMMRNCGEFVEAVPPGAHLPAAGP